MSRSVFHTTVFIAVLAVMLLDGCEQHDPVEVLPSESPQTDNAQFVISKNRVMLEESGLLKGDERDSPGRHGLLERQLLDARRGTARYRNINNAIADGYVDIQVVVPHMGFHYMKASLADETFDPSHPEILVYNNFLPEQHPRLVAVEFAVPLNLSASAPEGFAGDFDQWERNETFGLWLVHAWVWYPNPSGVFSPTNPLVP